jgi:hypothetical protein
LLAAACFACGALAKRVPPKPVTPVQEDGVEYSADGNGWEGFVVASDPISRKELWRVRLFKIRINTWVEIDVQSVYVTTLRWSAKGLYVRDERSKCYLVNIKSRSERNVSCAEMDSTLPSH